MLASAAANITPSSSSRTISSPQCGVPVAHACQPNCTTTPGCTVIRSFQCTSMAACCAACQTQAGCIQYTLNTAAGGNHHTGNNNKSSLCHLRSAVTPTQSGNECTSATLTLGPPPPPPPQDAKHVLVIIVDDLRPQLNETYGNSQMVTPHMDALARGGIAFHRAYVQISVCGPSRNSFMTGRRPDTTMAWSFTNDFRTPGKDGRPATGANWTTMPQWFKKNGYITLGGGKT